MLVSVIFLFIFHQNEGTCVRGQKKKKKKKNMLIDPFFCCDIFCPSMANPLRKQAYSNILKILPPKKKNFQIKI